MSKIGQRFFSTFDQKLNVIQALSMQLSRIIQQLDTWKTSRNLRTSVS